jgi:hypothetical protein
VEKDTKIAIIAGAIVVVIVLIIATIVSIYQPTELGDDSKDNYEKNGSLSFTLSGCDSASSGGRDTVLGQATRDYEVNFQVSVVSGRVNVVIQDGDISLKSWNNIESLTETYQPGFVNEEKLFNYELFVYKNSYCSIDSTVLITWQIIETDL